MSSTPNIRTAWHPMAFRLIQHFLPPRWEAIEEFSLSQLPHRIDIVILRRLPQDAPAGAFEIRGLNSIFNRFRLARVQHALLEVKSPTDALSPGDLFTFIGHANLYLSFNNLTDPAAVVLLTLSDGLPTAFREQVAEIGGEFSEVGPEPGVWEVRGLMFRLFCVDTAVASQHSGNHLLYPFTRRFLKHPQSVVDLLTPEEESFFVYLCQQVVQLKKVENTDLLKDYTMLNESAQKALLEVIRDLPLEIRLAALSPEERLEGLDPEERLKGLDPEERLKGLDPEERLKGLDPEERLKGLDPEERLKGLEPEEILQHFKPEQLARALDPETRERLKRLL